jgi:hypothetical protein
MIFVTFHPRKATRLEANASCVPSMGNFQNHTRSAMKAFETWLATTPHAVTLFVIADLFESDEFGEWFSALLAKHGERLTVGCHGLTHRSWSAWPEDSEGFEASLNEQLLC